MPSLRLATFNVENLLMRCDFSAPGIEGLRQKLTSVSDQGAARRVASAFNVLSEDDRTLTAQALAATRAEVCALQEVENLVTLTTFHDRYLSRWSERTYSEHVLFEGNDGRGIDVGVLSQAPVVRKVSHAGKTYQDLGIAPPPGVSPSARAFRRDCLEVDIQKDGEVLTLFVCHFKSMHGGRAKTRAIREAEARGVRALIEARFDDPANANWVILGDLNDYLEIDGTASRNHGLSALVQDGFAADLAMARVPDPYERWSHHYAALDQYTALDHILLSPRLLDLNSAADIAYVRAGMAWRSTRHRGFRLPGIGWQAPKASDHCPLVATIEF